MTTTKKQAILFDWGDTVMRNFPSYAGAMHTWQRRWKNLEQGCPDGISWAPPYPARFPFAGGVPKDHKRVPLLTVMFLETLVANTVAESNVGMFGYIGLKLVPISLVVTDSFTMHTNR